jgi:hypothetical protein
MPADDNIILDLTSLCARLLTSQILIVRLDSTAWRIQASSPDRNAGDP